jgi:putative serine/threonine protein kinase
MDKLSILEPKAVYLVCFPKPFKNCLKRISLLKSIGVDYLCDYGRIELWTPQGMIRVLGKGHAGVVVAARYKGSLVAVKIRRTDSKRASLADEGVFQSISARAGVAPKVFFYSHDFIVSELIEGPLLLDIIKRGKLNLKYIIEAIEAVTFLDKLNILHQEISRPLKNIIFTPTKAVIVDFESAKRGCGNLSKFLSWLFNYLNIDYKVLSKELKDYKLNCQENADKLKSKIIKIISKLY